MADMTNNQLATILRTEFRDEFATQRVDTASLRTELKEGLAEQRHLLLDFMAQMQDFQNMVSDRFVSYDQKFDHIYGVLDTHTGLLEGLDLEVKSISISLQDNDSRINLLEAQ